ncbi:Uncharacterized protein Fot_15211 [Forsythia ovata]|uniref:Cysteine-rich transmembrane CYSTM domain-containing protein n=1 Tax=Forsythia ovata TaxID=205694 RepID=A0ABD1WAY0_9LAMI
MDSSEADAAVSYSTPSAIQPPHHQPLRAGYRIHFIQFDSARPPRYRPLPMGTQGGSPNGNYVDNSQLPAPAPPQPHVSTPGRWSSGLCDCFSDVPNCCITCWCPCITFGHIAESIDRGSTRWRKHVERQNPEVEMMPPVVEQGMRM